jgi:hypothetical protein
MRPNVLLLNDHDYFLQNRYEEQKQRFDSFLIENASKSITVLEVGVGIYGKTGTKLDIGYDEGSIFNCFYDSRY